VLCVGSCLWALPSQALSLKAPEYLKSLMKNPIVVVKILMLYLIINDLWSLVVVDFSHSPNYYVCC
jgi:hypothetical protein